MSVLPDHWIRDMAKRRGLIEPFADGRRRKGRISSGPSSYGYDFRLADEYKLPQLGGGAVMDPKSVAQLHFQDHRGRSCLIPAGSFVLARSLEYFRIPRDILALCQGKSTYARCGLIVNVTPLEPGWEGYITICLVNGGQAPLRVHSKEGIGQVLFFKAEIECAVSYDERQGKYQAQKEIRLSRA